ncbi:MAG: hypothetical protein IKE27_02150 [Oscillospiraceae bacterium]|nr:hypothetical protein [Oscillospiraceae bacterium]
MKYLITGSVIVDNLKYLDGRFVEHIKGGCAIYSYYGVKLFEDDCACLAGVGEDFEALYGDWLRRNGMSEEGFLIKDEHCIQSVLAYNEDGTYYCKSIYFDDDRGTVIHNPALNLSYSDLEPFLPGLKGLYLYSDIDGLHGKAYAGREKYGYKTMFECPNDMTSEYLPRFFKTIEQSDYYSFNRPESFRLFETDSEEKVIEIIREIGLPCFYRVGTRGAYMLTADEGYFVPAVVIREPQDDIDPTGCGNSSTAACMWALTEGKSPLEACIIGNVTAGFNALQYGPPEDITGISRSSAMAMVPELLEKYKNSARIY